MSNKQAPSKRIFPNHQGMRDLLAAIIHKAIKDAEALRDGRIMTFESSTGMGKESQQIFRRFGGRLTPQNDIHIFFTSRHFESWCYYLDLDPEVVREKLHAQGLLTSTSPSILQKG